MGQTRTRLLHPHELLPCSLPSTAPTAIAASAYPSGVTVTVKVTSSSGRREVRILRGEMRAAKLVEGRGVA